MYTAQVMHDILFIRFDYPISKRLGDMLRGNGYKCKYGVWSGNQNKERILEYLEEYQPDNRKIYPPTLCWSCRNSVGSRCEWSKDLKPVPGWTAIETEISYCVMHCPKFARG